MARVDLGRVVGYSAYEIAVQNGYEGTEQQWLASLKGETGSQGPVGPAGQDGTDGTNGQDGADGTTFTPSVSAEGIISWTNDGGKANPQSVNIKGPQGETGATGPAGTYTAGTGITISNDVISATQELPAMTSSDVGKVLKVNSTYDGVEWGIDASVSYTAGDNIDITNNEISVVAPIEFESTSGAVTQSTELQVGGLVLASEDDTDPNDPVNTELMIYPNTVYFTAYGENKALRMDEDGDLTFDTNKLAFADDIPEGYTDQDVLNVISSNFGLETSETTYYLQNSEGTIDFTDVYNNAAEYTEDPQFAAGKTYVLTLTLDGFDMDFDITLTQGTDARINYWAVDNPTDIDNNLGGMWFNYVDGSWYMEFMMEPQSISTIAVSLAYTTPIGTLDTDFIPVDGTTITVNQSGELQAVGGGSSLPSDPSADGTYILQNVISSGVSTKSWVAVSQANGNNF